MQAATGRVAVERQNVLWRRERLRFGVEKRTNGESTAIMIMEDETEKWEREGQKNDEERKEKKEKEIREKDREERKRGKKEREREERRR